MRNVAQYGVLAPASPFRSRIAPQTPPAKVAEAEALEEAKAPKRGGTYRPWAELLRRTFDVDVLLCGRCGGPMKLIAMVTDPKSVTRYLAPLGELVEVPDRSPSRGPPYWKSTVLRRKALADAA
jgi:hypothetical protein